MAAKPVVVDFLGRNAQIKASIAETSAAIAALDRQIAAGQLSMDKLSASNERWGKALVTTAKVGAVGMAGLATALGGAVVVAAQFDSAMRNVNSISGLSEKGFKSLEARVLALSTAVGKSPTDLANGLYSIVSSGFKANAAMTILTAGARAARAGLTDTATATAAITGVLNAYGGGARDARKDSDLLFQTVNVGVENFTQLAGSIGKVLPQGKALGVSLQDLLAAQAALTRQGNSADESSTQLGQIFTSLEKPSKALSAELKTMGYESGQAAIAHLGLKGTLDLLGKAVDGNQAELAKWFPNIRALRGVDGLEGTAHAADLFTASVKAMNDATKGAGVTAQVYAEQQKSTSAQFDHLKASLDVAAITIGTALLPQINAGIQALDKWFASAQKSGEITSFAKTVSTDVQATVKWLEGLGPAADQGIHAVSSAFSAAIPYAEGLEKVIKALAPEFEAVGRATVGLTKGIGAGPIIGATIAYLALNRAMLTAQAGVGKYAQIMKAGAEATALAGGGAVSAKGKIDSVGKAAIANSSTASIAARGIASAFGPTLLVAGAAGIVGSLLYIKSTMTSLKDEAHDVVEALAQLQGAKVAKAAANIAVRQQKAVVAGDRKSVGSASVAVNTAQFRLAQAYGSGNPEAEIQAQKNLDAVYLHQQGTILKLQSDKNQLTQDQQDAAAAAAKEGDAQKKLGEQLVGLTQKAQGAQGSGGGASFLGSDAARIAAAAANTRDQQRNVDKLANSIRNAAAASTTLDAAGKGAANKVADVIQALDLIPSKKQTTIIADDIAAGKSLANIKKDLGIIAIAKPKPTVDLNAGPFFSKMKDVNGSLSSVLLPHPIGLSIPGAPSVQRALDNINSSILHLSSTPFSIAVNEVFGTKKKTPGGATGMYISGQHGADDVHVRLTGSEAVLAPVHQRMVDSGQYTVRGALNATGAPTIHRGGGYAGGGKPAKPADMKFEAFPLTVYQNRQSNADNAVKADRARLRAYTGEFSKINNSISKAQEKVSTAKTAKTRASYEKAAAELERKSQTRLNTLSPLISNQQFLLSQDVPKYQEATRVAKLAAGFAAKIKRDQDNASEANSQMQLASDRWSQATTPSAKSAALAAYSAAQKRRSGANKNLLALLSQAKSTIGDTGSQYFRDTQAAITAAQIDQTQNQDATGAPGYVAPGTSFDASSLVFLSAEHQYQLDKALQLDANGNPVDPGTAKYLLGLELANAQRGEAIATASGNFATASQIVQTENDIQGQLAQLSQPATPSADVQAQLTQSQAQVDALTRGQGFQSAFGSVLAGSGDLAQQGGFGAMVFLGDQASLRAGASFFTKGVSGQSSVSSNRFPVMI